MSRRTAPCIRSGIVPNARFQGNTLNITRSEEKMSLVHGKRGKGPWRSARTMATQTGMTNQWLKDQGLIVVKELWVNIHYPAMTR